jgi:glycosyltransferase involved in cell wall biosynthesis
LKILLCHNFYQQSGGEDAAVRALKALLEAEGHQVIFYSEDNQEIEQYGGFQKIRFFPRTMFSARTYRRLHRIAAQEKPDIAHVQNVFPLLSPALYVALKSAGIPIVQSIQNYRLMCINGLFLREGRICELCKNGNFLSSFRFKCYRDNYLLSGLYALTISGHRHLGTFKKIDQFIAPTRYVAEKLVESGVADLPRVSVLGNFLPRPLPNYGRADLQNPYIFYVGRLSREKGIFTLLNAIREVPRVKLKVAGSGPLASDVKGYIQSNRIRNVELLGFVSDEEKYDLLRGALCCVLPSECYEGFPVVLLESAAVGTPIIASRIGSLATLVSNEDTGLLFNPRDATDLRTKLERLVADPAIAIKMGEQARCWLETAHTPEAHHKALMNIYQQEIR